MPLTPTMMAFARGPLPVLHHTLWTLVPIYSIGAQYSINELNKTLFKTFKPQIYCFVDFIILCVGIFYLIECLYSMCVQCPQKPEHSVRSVESELQMVVSHNVGAGNRT